MKDIQIKDFPKDFLQIITVYLEIIVIKNFK